MKAKSGMVELIDDFMEEEGLSNKGLADIFNTAEITVRRWLDDDAKPSGPAEAILLTSIGLRRLKSQSGDKRRDKAKKTAVPKFDGPEIVQMPGFLPEYRFPGETVVPKPAAKDTAAETITGAAVARETTLSDHNIAWIFANVFQPAGIPFAEAAGSLASGLAIYRLLRRLIAGDTNEDARVQALENTIRSLAEKQRQAQKIEILEKRLKAEKEKMASLCNLKDSLNEE